MKKKIIGVLLGGLSKEREISLKSGRAIAKGLREAGFENVREIDVGFDLASKLKSEEIEVAFIALHGKFGEDGSIQGLLEFMRIPYTGSGVLGSALAMNKQASKLIFMQEKIPTADFRLYRKNQGIEEILKSIGKSGMGFPLVVKPASEGSTIGLTVVEEKSDMEEAVKIALDHGDELVVEKFIKGIEVTVGILNGVALPLVEIAPKEGIFDYKSKYTKGLTDYYVPARVSKDISDKARELGLRAFESLHCEGFGRTDIILENGKNPIVLEVNSIPGMTETSLIPKAAKQIGLEFKDLVEKIISGASLKIEG